MILKLDTAKGWNERKATLKRYAEMLIKNGYKVDYEYDGGFLKAIVITIKGLRDLAKIITILGNEIILDYCSNTKEFQGIVYDDYL